MSNLKLSGICLCLASAAVLLTAPAVGGVQGPCQCTGDLNSDGVVDGADLGLLLGSWGAQGGSADLNSSGLVDGADLGLLLGAWGPCGAPANDLCANAQTITAGGSYPFCTIGSNTDGPPIGSGECEAPGLYHDVWFIYHALSDGALKLSTCPTTDFDTQIAVYGSTIPGLSPCPTDGIGFATFIGCNDDVTGCGVASTITFNVTAGNNYRIRLGGWGQFEFGTGVLSATLTQPGESCVNSIDTNFGLFQTVEGNTSDNPTDNSYPSECFGSQPRGPTEWIRWQSTCQGIMTVSTCNPGTDYDTIITVLRYEFQGNCWDSFVECNDDSPQPGCQIVEGGANRKSYLQHGCSPGEVFYILVSGWNGSSGNYELTIDLNCN